MSNIRSSIVVSTIAIILLLVVTEQANAFTIIGDCFGPATDACEQICKSKGYKEAFFGSFRDKTGCCCRPPKKQTYGQSNQLKY
ncbi:hypothetical protein N665_0701s0007 [Sinapis alba]|nr:hypothetical protein N665_1886s0001 [Sinapis alba]KAF8084776.1 hypothetical protein N665_0701s0006 [Sinapis alba]KAF8084777.1 hypothetical protein N665_0701s0007 [Sinapis alba]